MIFRIKGVWKKMWLLRWHKILRCWSDWAWAGILNITDTCNLFPAPASNIICERCYQKSLCYSNEGYLSNYTSCHILEKSFVSWDFFRVPFCEPFLNFFFHFTTVDRYSRLNDFKNKDSHQILFWKLCVGHFTCCHYCSTLTQLERNARFDWFPFRLTVGGTVTRCRWLEEKAKLGPTANAEVSANVRSL